MDIDKIKVILEDLKVDEDKVNEFLQVYRINEKEDILDDMDDKEFEVWKLMNEEERDWRRKTQLAAKLISLKLEDY